MRLPRFNSPHIIWVAGLVSAAARFVLYLLLVGLSASTEDFEPVMFPLRMDPFSPHVAQFLWERTGWPAEYSGPADGDYLIVCLITWFAVGLLVGILLASGAGTARLLKSRHGAA